MPIEYECMLAVLSGSDAVRVHTGTSDLRIGMTVIGVPFEKGTRIVSIVDYRTIKVSRPVKAGLRFSGNDLGYWCKFGS